MNGWLIVGGSGGGGTTSNLDPSEYMGDHLRLPAARNFKPGQWLEWRIAGVSVFVVCVEHPDS